MNLFCPEIWPEISTPDCQADCQGCGLYQQGSRMIWGEGYSNAPIMILLDNPGAREDRDGSPIVCGTRQTLQTAIHEVGLEKEHFFVTYILKRRPVRAYDKEKTRSICMQHLEEQLTERPPSLIICLGNVAVQSFFRNSELDVKGLRGNWHKVNGFRTTAAYHPLATRRRPNLYPLLVEDMRFVAEEWERIKEWGDF